MDPEVAALVEQERVAEGAELASLRGDFKTASALFERACNWNRAALEAEKSGDLARALALAVEAEDDETAERVLPKLLRDRQLAAGAVLHLERRGAYRWSARLLEAL